MNMNTHQTLPCPSCQTPIPFQVDALIAGTQFACPGCDARIGLGADSIPKVEEVMARFNDLKERLKAGEAEEGTGDEARTA